MVSPIINEQFYDGAFLISEANGHRSRTSSYLDNNSGSDVLYEAGLVVSLNSAGVDSSAHPANTGNGTIGGLSVLTGSEFGVYTLTALTATTFNVVAPTGDVVGVATVGTAFANQVGFTITAGSTAFAVGDSFTLTVTQQAGSWQSWTGGTIGTLGILYNRVWVSAGTSKKVTIMQRDCEVNMSEVQFDPAVTAAGNAATLIANAFAALLTTNNIIGR